ncbi:LCP family protein [Pseudonocardia sp. ICBG601]|uniref:LCP family glycopolymer transferase n=1 Tax=Pseudonocardia sp. ICBG601 TaxID=2846759 RepID=UPI0027E318A1|nr:LCP family protein [Pseudonocardia sp. ICBG601]
MDERPQEGSRPTGPDRPRRPGPPERARRDDRPHLRDEARRGTPPRDRGETPPPNDRRDTPPPSARGGAAPPPGPAGPPAPQSGRPGDRRPPQSGRPPQEQPSGPRRRPGPPAPGAPRPPAGDPRPGTGPAARPGGRPPGPPDGAGRPAEDESWLPRREREARAAARRAAAWSSRSTRDETPGRGGHSDSRPTDIRSIRATRRGIGETVKVPGRPDTAAEHRRHRASEPDAPPEERDRAARLSGELPIVPRRPGDRPGGPVSGGAASGGAVPGGAAPGGAGPGDRSGRAVPGGRPGGAVSGGPVPGGAGASAPAGSRPDAPSRPGGPAVPSGPGQSGPGQAGPASVPPGGPRRPGETRPGGPDPRSGGRPDTGPQAVPGRPAATGQPGGATAAPSGAQPSGAVRPDGTPGRPDTGRPDGPQGRPADARPAGPGGSAPEAPRDTARSAPPRPPHTGLAAGAAAGTAAAGSAAAGGSVAKARGGRGDARDEDTTLSPPAGPSAAPDPARRTLAAALGLTAASTLVPGSGHLALRRRRTGGLILGTLVAIVVGLAALVLLARRSTLLQNLLSTTTLTVIAGALVVAGIAWIAQVARTYALARPRGMPLGRKILGTGTAALLCLTVAVPFGYGVELVNSQRGLLNSLFQGGGTSAAEALGKPRLNVLLLGSDAGDDRTGTRTDTMMVASIDTRSGRTTLFSLPRNIQRAEFPPGSPAAEKFPNGFHDPSQPLSGDYLLNAIYAYAQQHPEIAPSGPTSSPGINLLQSSIAYMTGLPLDYYLEVNMAGFSSMIDAVGGVTVNVGPEPIPVGGVTAFGRHVTPDRYISPGVQTLGGEDALWFARSRRDGTDYQRMGRQRCLIQAVISQTTATELISRFQSIAAVTRDNVATDMPQQVLPALAVLADEGFRLESVAFDPSLPDPNSSTGYFVTADPDVSYMREVVRNAIADPAPEPASGTAPALAAPTTQPSPSTESSRSSSASASPTPDPAAALPQSVEESCAATGAADVPAGGEPGTSQDPSATGSTGVSGSDQVDGLRPDQN